MADAFFYLWLGIAGLVGYGAALFFAFFALDDPRTPKLLQPVVYIIAWIILGTMLSLCALLAIPVMLLFLIAVFVIELLQKGRIL